MSRHSLLLATNRPWVALGAIAFLAIASAHPALAQTPAPGWVRRLRRGRRLRRYLCFGMKGEDVPATAAW